MTAPDICALGGRQDDADDRAGDLSATELRLLHLVADNVPRYAWLRPYLPPAQPMTPREEQQRAASRALIVRGLA